MDAAGNNNAAAPEVVDLENGGGGGAVAVVEVRAYPADKRLKERQPFAWLGAAPYAAVVLAGAAFVAAGLTVIYHVDPATMKRTTTADGQTYYTMTTAMLIGTALLCAGTAIAFLGIVVGCHAVDEGCCDCNLRRFGPD